MTSIVSDDFSPIYAGNTAAPFAPQFLHKDGTEVDLSGATITMIMEDAEGNAKNATGTWVIDSASTGQAHYNYSSADVAIAGNWTLYITITNGSGPVTADTKQLEIQPMPVVV